MCILYFLENVMYKVLRGGFSLANIQKIAEWMSKNLLCYIMLRGCCFFFHVMIDCDGTMALYIQCWG